MWFLVICLVLAELALFLSAKHLNDTTPLWLILCWVQYSFTAIGLVILVAILVNNVREPMNTTLLFAFIATNFLTALTLSVLGKKLEVTSR